MLKYSGKIYVTLTMPKEEYMRGSFTPEDLWFLPLKTIRSLTLLCERTQTSIEDPIVMDNTQNDRFKGNAELRFLENNIFVGKQKYQEKNEKISVNVLGDIKKEIKFAACTIKKLICEEGYRYNDFAIICPDAGEIEKQSGQIFEAEDIPVFFDVNYTAFENPFSAFIMALTDMISKNFETKYVLEFIKFGFLDFDFDDVDLFENYIIAKGIRGIKNYRDEWVLLKRGDGVDELAKLNELRQRFITPLDELYSVVTSSKADVKTKIEAIIAYFEVLDISGKLQMRSEALKEVDAIRASHFERIYNAVIKMFDNMSELCGKDHVSVKDFGMLIKVGLKSIKLGFLPASRDYVLIGDLERSRLTDIKVMFIIGANDGQLPKVVTDNGVLSEGEAEVLKSKELELSMSVRERVFIQRYYLYMVMSKPSDRLYITYSHRGPDGADLKRSSLINYIKNIFPKLCITDESELDDLYFARSPKGAKDLIVDNIDSIISNESTSAIETLYSWYRGNGYIDTVFEGRETAYNSETGFDNSKAVYGDMLNLSVTGLERFAGCPYDYYLKYGLKLSEREIYGFNYADFGNILHAAFDIYTGLVEDKGQKFTEGSNELEDEAFDLAILNLTNNYLSDSYRAQYIKRRMHRIFKRTIQNTKKEFSASLFAPIAHEQKFSGTYGLDSASFNLKDGKLNLNGKIDRIDMLNMEDALALRVVDYKTGNTSFDASKTMAGISLQLPVYLKVAYEIASKRYKDKRIVMDGAYYSHVDDPIVEDAGKGVEAELEKTSKLEGAALEGHDFSDINDVIDDIILKLGNDIYSGNIAKTPYRYGNENACTYCEYKSICTFDDRIDDYKNLKK